MSKVSTDRALADIPRRIVPALYTRAGDLLDAGLDYQDASQLCSAAHAGTVYLTQVDGVIHANIVPAEHDRQYAASEMMGPHDLDVVTPPALFYAWSRRLIDRPTLIDRISQSIRLRNRIIRYEFRQDYAIELAAEMHGRREIVPDGWNLPWGDRRATELLLNSLTLRCMYHVIAAHFGAEKLRLAGGGEESLCLVTTSEQLVWDLGLLTSLPVASVRQFVEFMTYGQGTKSPDSALQPLVATSRYLLVPCFLISSSNLERNLLALHARVDKSRFDAQSDLFERDMLERADELCSARWLSKRNTFPLGLKGEEIDLLVWDLTCRAILICEMRWMLQPGDPREVQNRKVACQEKVAQLARKVIWVRHHLAAIQQFLGIGSDDAKTTEWTVDGVVVIETFAGTLSPSSNFPIVPIGIFALGVQNARSLNHLNTWAKSLDWLPREGNEFATSNRELKAKDLRVDVSCLEVKVSRGEYLDRVRQELLQQSGGADFTA